MKRTLEKGIQIALSLLLVIMIFLTFNDANRMQETAGARIIVLVMAFSAILLLLLAIAQLLRDSKALRTSSEPTEQVVWDTLTNLPNKNKCDEIINYPGAVQEATIVYMFDLHNLKYVNNNFGRDAGDNMLTNFAQLIRASVPEEFFVGRYIGDKFIVIITGSACRKADEIVSTIRTNTDAYNQTNPEATVHYAYGSASSADMQGAPLQALLTKAEKNMFTNKRQTKKDPMEFEGELNASLKNMIQALGREYTDCCYCNAKTGGYHLFGGKIGSNIPKNGMVKTGMIWLSCLIGDRTERAEFLEKLSIPYISEHLDEQHTSYDVTCHFRGVKRNWWKLTAVYVDSDDGQLHHFLLLFKEISGEKELEFEAKHDGLTGLWNKTVAFELMEDKMSENGKQYNMLIFDLDDFKQVNDTMGHAAGDTVIKKVAEIIRSHFRDTDVVARFGGDEFFVFAEGELSREILQGKADSIRQTVKNHFEQTYKAFEVTISIGIVVRHEQMPVPDMFHEADEALYAAKRHGKNQSVLLVDGKEVQ